MFLLASYANEPELMPALVAELGRELLIEPQDVAASWGLGYYADERALTMRRRADGQRGRGPFGLSSSDIRSRILLIGGTPVGATPGPRRFRRWLFSHVGDLASLEPLRERIREGLPDFLRSELAEGKVDLPFAMVLADLSRDGILDDSWAQPTQVENTFCKAVRGLRALSCEVDLGPVDAAFALTDGRQLLISHFGVGLAIRERMGLESLPDGPPDPAHTDFNKQVEALRNFRSVVVTHFQPDAPLRPHWEAVPPSTCIKVDAQLRISSRSVDT